MNRSAFDDIPDQGFGALGGGAADQLDRVTTTVVPSGIETKCLCGRCGVKNAIDIGWDEVVIGSVQLVPPDWDVDRASGTLFPRVGCAMGGCHYLLKIGYAPSELHRYVMTGIEQGLITKEWAGGFAQQMKARSGR